MDIRKLVSGFYFFFFFLGSSLISWKSKKQTIVSRSSSKAEYQALTQATCEAQWLLYLLHDFGNPHSSPSLIYCDNQSTIQIAGNLVFHEHTKHIEIDYHIIHGKIHRGVIHLLPISTHLQVVNILTKRLLLQAISASILQVGHD